MNTRMGPTRVKLSESTHPCVVWTHLATRLRGPARVQDKEAWPFYRTSSGVRLCWELEEPEGPKGQGADAHQEDDGERQGADVLAEEGRG